MVSFMVTNGGPHPADKWAEMTANTIVDTLLQDAHPDDASELAVAARAAKRKLRSDLFDLFNGHHDSVQKAERANNATYKKPADSAVRLLAPIDVTLHLGVIDQVNVLFSQTPWAKHLMRPEVQEAVTNIIARDSANVIHIERRWHHDRMTTKGA